MSGVNGRPDAAAWPWPEEIRNQTERSLKQVMAAAQVAQAMWRLMMADRGRHWAAQVQLAQWREGALPQPAAQTARRVIDSYKQRQEPALDVYVRAVFAAALASTDSPDAAALVMLDLASLHVRLGYPGDALRLLHVAAHTGDAVSERTHKLLAWAKASIAEPAHGQPYANDIHVGHYNDGEKST